MSILISPILLGTSLPQPPIDPSQPVVVTIEVAHYFWDKGVVMKLRLKDARPIVVNGEAIAPTYEVTASAENGVGSIQCYSTATLLAAGAPTGKYIVDVAQFGVNGVEVEIGSSGGSVWTALEAAH